jgi:hypothetical protein
MVTGTAVTSGSSGDVGIPSTAAAIGDRSATAIAADARDAELLIEPEVFCEWIHA